MVNIWIVATLVLATITTADFQGFKCWNCQGEKAIGKLLGIGKDKDPWCVESDNLNALGSLKQYAMETCASKKCLIQYQSYYEGARKHVITRKCAPLNQSAIGCSFSINSLEGFGKRECVCDSSLCNSAKPGNSINILFGGITIFAVMNLARIPTFVNLVL